MPAYETDEARLEVPERWIDRSVHSLEYSRPGGVVRVMMQRAPHEGDALRALHEERVRDLRRRLAGYELVREEELLVAGRPAFELAIRYRDHEEHLYQRTVSLIVGPRFVTVGVVAPVGLASDADELFQRLRATITIRREADGA